MDLVLRNINFEKKKPLIGATFNGESGLYGSSVNDFEVEITYDENVNQNDIITYGNTEWGGKIQAIEIENSKMRLTGKTFRGQMEMQVVNPFAVLVLSGTDYEIVSELINKTSFSTSYVLNATGRTSKKTVVIPQKSSLLKAIDIVLAVFNETMSLYVANKVFINLKEKITHRYDYSQNTLLFDEGGELLTGLHIIGKVNGAETNVSVFYQPDGSVSTSRWYGGFYAYEITENISDNCASLADLRELASDRLLALRSSKLKSEIEIKIDTAEIGDAVNVSILKINRKVMQKVIGKRAEIKKGLLKTKIITGG